MSSESSGSGLISLLEKARENRQKISVAVKIEFTTIAELRKLSVPWVEIAESLGFAGRFHGVEKAFLRRKRKLGILGNMVDEVEISDKPSVPPKRPEVPKIPAIPAASTKKGIANEVKFSSSFDINATD